MVWTYEAKWTVYWEDFGPGSGKKLKLWSSKEVEPPKIKHAKIVVKGGNKWKLLTTHVAHVLEENKTGTATQQLMKYC